jgi:hypothetical protein
MIVGPRPSDRNTPWCHTARNDAAETDWLELRNPSRLSCGVANMQLRQGFRLALRARKAARHDGGAVQYARLVGFEPWSGRRK